MYDLLGSGALVGVYVGALVRVGIVASVGATWLELT
jgi:hypothetical protein